MSKKESAAFDDLLNSYLEDEKVRQMASYKAHGRTDILSHSLNVARLAYSLDGIFGHKADRQILAKGALLHDYYQYDWHEKKNDGSFFDMHGFSHPRIACDNAIRDFKVDESVQEVIRCHMWPLTLSAMPRSREAILVCLADKLCALKETVNR